MYCPMKFNKSISWIDFGIIERKARCEKEKCAWWEVDGKRCSVLNCANALEAILTKMTG